MALGTLTLWPFSFSCASAYMGSFGNSFQSFLLKTLSSSCQRERGWKTERKGEERSQTASGCDLVLLQSTAQMVSFRSLKSQHLANCLLVPALIKKKTLQTPSIYIILILCYRGATEILFIPEIIAKSYFSYRVYSSPDAKRMWSKCWIWRSLFPL